MKYFVRVLGLMYCGIALGYYMQGGVWGIWLAIANLHLFIGELASRLDELEKKRERGVVRNDLGTQGGAWLS